MVLGLHWMSPMKSNPRVFHSLSHRIVAQFCLFTLAFSAIYGLFLFLFLYHLEDNFIEREITQEAEYLTTAYQENTQWPRVRNSYMTLYLSATNFPDDLKQQFKAEPQSKEFFGNQGRHYHLFKLPKHNNVYLVAEVSQKLLVRNMRGDVIKYLLINGLILTLIACLIAWMLGRKTVKPLKQLADLVDGVAPENIPDTFAHQFPNNEIGILARALEESMGKIGQTLEREKCFTRDVSHELRTPVAIIKNAVEVYQQADLSKEDAKQVVNRIADASIQMEQTVTTLLVLAREEHTSAENEPVKLLPLIEQSIINHCYLLGDKAVEVSVDDNCDTAIFSQRGMLKVLLDNLLSNAFQYTEAGEVKVSYVDNKLIIEDTGSGIEPHISTSVTEPAVKGSQSTGYGFGLSIVKRLCDNQGWLLNVVSNKGTSISVSFKYLGSG